MSAVADAASPSPTPPLPPPPPAPPGEGLFYFHVAEEAQAIRTSGKIQRSHMLSNEEQNQLEHELISYFQTCIFTGDLPHAERVFKRYLEDKVI